jgi:hypothetical protein
LPLSDSLAASTIPLGMSLARPLLPHRINHYYSPLHDLHPYIADSSTPNISAHHISTHLYINDFPDNFLIIVVL